MQSRLAATVPLVLLFFFSSSPARGAPTPPGYLQETLANGLRVSILPDSHHPVVATRLFYHVGAANEDAATFGFAHLFEHLMFAGTTAHGASDYDELHHRHGGYHNAFTSADETVYESTIIPGPHEQVLALEADRMVHLAIDERALAKEKKVVLEELRLRDENDALSRLRVSALGHLLGAHPYGHSIIGNRGSLGAATLANVRAFYERYYRPGNAHLVIVGPVDSPATLALIRRLFGAIPAGSPTPPPKVPALLGWQFPQDSEFHEDIPPVNAAALAFPLPPAKDPDAIALRVMAQLLSGSLDPVREELVRRRRKAWSAGTGVAQRRRGGALFFYSATLPYRRKATAFRLLEETRRSLLAFTWLTEARLRAAKRALTNDDLGATYFAERRAVAIGRAAWWEDDETLAFHRAAATESVTAADVRRVFLRYVAEPTPVRIFIRPDHIPLRVRLFGWLVDLFR